MSVNTALTVDAWQVGNLPAALKREFLAWLYRVAPRNVADNAFHLALYEGCVEVTFYVVDKAGRRYMDGDCPAQATWQEEGCEVPPAEPLRLALGFRQRTRQTEP